MGVILNQHCTPYRTLSFSCWAQAPRSRGKAEIWSHGQHRGSRNSQWCRLCIKGDNTCRGGAAEPQEENGKQAFVEVFVGGLPPDASDYGVEAAFKAVGEVLSVRLNRRKKTGECKGFGFIRFADQATAERACLVVKEVRSHKPCALEAADLFHLTSNYLLSVTGGVLKLSIPAESYIIKSILQLSGCYRKEKR